MVKRYIILAGDTPQDLSDEVECLLEEGWTLHGMPFYSHGYDVQPFHQAMIHKDAEPELILKSEIQ